MKRILIVSCGALGDLVCITSVIDALRFEYGNDIVIDFVCTPSSGGLFDVDKRVNKVYPLRHRKIPLWLSLQKKHIVKSSAQKPYDLLINYESGKQFKDLIDGVVAEKKIGGFFGKVDIPSNITHVIDTAKYIFKDIVSDEVYAKSFPNLMGSSVKMVKRKYNLNSQYIVISPSNSHQKKGRFNYRAWENTSWKTLIKKLSEDIQVVIIGNKEEDVFFSKLQPYPANVIDLVGKTILVDLIGVIDGAVGLVATDTGTAHIASAVNTEVFALIGPTPENGTAPYQTSTNKVNIIRLNLACSPCYKTEVMRNCKDNVCMSGISVDMVYNTIKSSDLLDNDYI